MLRSLQAPRLLVEDPGLKRPPTGVFSLHRLWAISPHFPCLCVALLECLNNLTQSKYYKHVVFFISMFVPSSRGHDSSSTCCSCRCSSSDCPTPPHWPQSFLPRRRCNHRWALDDVKETRRSTLYESTRNVQSAPMFITLAGGVEEKVIRPCIWVSSHVCVWSCGMPFTTERETQMWLDTDHFSYCRQERNCLLSPWYLPLSWGHSIYPTSPTPLLGPQWNVFLVP